MLANQRFDVLCLIVCVVWQLESLPVMVQGVWSDDPSSQLEATTQFRKLLSIGMYRTYIQTMLFMKQCTCLILTRLYLFSTLLSRAQSSYRWCNQSRCGPAVCGIPWKARSASTTSRIVCTNPLFSSRKITCLKITNLARIDFVFMCSLRLRGLWLMLLLEHQSIRELSLTMVLFLCLCSFLVLEVMMSESRLTLASSFVNFCCCFMVFLDNIFWLSR